MGHLADVGELANVRFARRPKAVVRARPAFDSFETSRFARKV
jgi:hypothetical protein